MSKFAEGKFPRPDPNTYWVVDGRFLAGEYPGARDPAAAREKVAAFRKAGVTTFIDLTEANELAPYEGLLAQTGVEYRRLSIRDLDVPRTPAHLHEILDAIDDALARGRTVYLHCWGGIGRTGTVVACWLQRTGLTPEQALLKLADFWRTVEKRHRRPHTPETREQVAWVHGWPAQMAARKQPPVERAGKSSGSITRQSRFRGSLLGLAAGDALGTTLEFRARGTFPPLTDMVGGGPFGLKAGQWTDDTSMGLCLAESLLERGGFDARDQMERYVRWWREGYLSSTGTCFDIGITVAGALRRFLANGEPFAGSIAPDTAGNGSLMRLAPVPLRFAGEGSAVAIKRAGESSRTTHGAAAAVDGCRYLAGLILGALAGASKEELLAPNFAPAGAEGAWRDHPLAEPVAGVAAGSFRTKEDREIRGSGYVVDSLEAALWAFARSSSFEEGALLAVNLGDDADTTGAVYGQLAGAFYGEEGIPERWLAKLHGGEMITGLADRLYEAAYGGPTTSPGSQIR